MATITTTEVLILNLLMKHTEGCYGSELMHLSEGKLKRGSIYSLLSRAETSGLVRSIQEPASPGFALPRTRYKITAHGRAALVDFTNWTGLAPPSFEGVA